MRRVGLTMLVLMLGGGLWATRAAALEMTCIEASKYKHLYQIFGGDPKKFAAFLQIDAKRLPHPEFCRAALITGQIEPASAQEVNKLLELIQKNQGWLAALHLSSSGGSIGAGYQLGFVTRAFWLKTTTARTFNGNLVYTPDFFVPPLTAPSAAAPAASPEGPASDPAPESELAQGWQTYLATQRKLASLKSGSGCVSACGQIHTAGIERFGVVRVHRGRFVGANSTLDTSRSMSATNEGMMRSEELLVSFYQQMDAGPDFIRNYQATPTETLTPVDVSRYPRYVSDYLNARCGSDPGQLQRLERQIEVAISQMTAPIGGQWIKIDRLRSARQKVREQRSKAEQCVAAAHESERLAAFDKVCKGGCSNQKLLDMVGAKIRDLGKGAR